MARLGDLVTVSASSEQLTGDKFWLLNLDMIEQQTGRIVNYLFVDETKLDGSIIQFDTDTVLYSKLRPNLNKVVLPQMCGYATSELLPLKPDSKLYKHYLAIYLRSDAFVTWAVSKTAGAKMPRLGTKELLNKDIPLPSLDEQKRIAECFEKINELIFLRKQQLSKLDELVKSRFIEMFGDPSANPYSWDVVNITNVVEGKVSNGFFAKRDEYTDDGNVRVLGVANIVNRMYSNVDDLPKTIGTTSDIQKFEVKYGDMLFCRSSLVAEGIGKASIVPMDVPPSTLFECHVIRLPLNLNKCVPEYMQVLSTTDYFRMQIISQSKTATMTTIGQDGILKTMIILPPIERQKQFLEFVKQIDKSKFEIQKSLEKLETLKKALMQKYFG